MYIMGNSCNTPPFGPECEKTCSSPGSCPGYESYKTKKAKDTQKCINPMSPACVNYCTGKDGPYISTICAPYQSQKQLKASNRYSDEIKAANQQKNRSISMTEAEQQQSALEAKVRQNKLIRGGGKNKRTNRNKSASSKRNNQSKKKKS
jgi:hypothetical protein